MTEASVGEQTLTQLIIPVVLAWTCHRLLLHLRRRKCCEIGIVDGDEESICKRMHRESDWTSSGQLLPSVQRPHPCIATKYKTDVV